MTNLQYVWICQGGLSSERDMFWLWFSYHQTPEGAKRACEMHAQTSGNGDLTWRNETDDFAQASCSRSDRTEYTITKEVVYP